VRQSGKTARGSLGLWWIDVGHFKNWLYARIAWPTDDPGGWHVHKGITEDYARQVTNEELIQLPSGRLVWKRTGSRENHFMDCEVLAAAGAHILGVNNLAAPVASPPAPAYPPPPSDPSLARSGI